MKVENIVLNWGHIALKHSLKPLLLFVLLIEWNLQTAYAERAVDHVIVATQPDTTQIHLWLYGDEHFNYALTEDDYVIVETANNGYVYADFRNGTIVPGNIMAHDADNRNAQEIAFLRTQPKGVPDYILAEKEKQLIRTKTLQSRFASQQHHLTKGSYHLPVILVEFADRVFQPASTPELFDRKFNQPHYDHNQATGSVRDYYQENSMDRLKLTFDIYGPVKVSYNAQYYAANEDQQAYEMVQEACEIAIREHGLLLSDYDIDGDGVVECLPVVYAGSDRAQGGGRTAIWAHTSYEPIKINNTQIASFMCTSELYGRTYNIDGIGTFCHEFGHVLGLPDFYDTFSGSSVLGRYMLMDSGNFNNNHNTPPCLTAIERYLLGWLDPAVLPKEEASVTLPPIGENQAYQINTTNDGEYFLLENRSPEGWDNTPELTQLGYGLLIYHIDRTPEKQALWSIDFNRYANANTLNADSKHYCCYLKKATDRETAFNQTTSDEFTAQSNNGAVAWDKTPVEMPITKIHYDNSLISFSVCEGLNGLLAPYNTDNLRCIYNRDGLTIIGMDGERAHIALYTMQGEMVGEWISEDNELKIALDEQPDILFVRISSNGKNNCQKVLRTK